MKYVLIDCKPVPEKLAPVMLTARKESGATLNSCLRFQGAVSFARDHGCHLSSQEELYDGWIHRRPGFNPANRPGQSTHELRNDGAAYRWWPVGFRIPWWAAGQDWSNSAAVLESYRRHGWIATLTYPTSSRERQHVNLRKAPKINLFRALKTGDKGARVRQMSGRLAYLGYLPGVNPKKGAGGFGPKVEAALKRFQAKHHLQADGVYGLHTHRQLLASVAHRKRARRAEVVAKRRAKRKPKPASGLSAKGASFIAHFEGFVDHPYNDPVGLATIGYGHLLHRGPVTAGDRRKWGKITHARGLELLRSDAAAAAAAVAKVKVKLNPSQRDALISFAYNVGTGAFASSTLLHKLNAGDYASVPSELRRWTKASGRELPGLVTRRKAEGALFANGTY